MQYLPESGRIQGSISCSGHAMKMMILILHAVASFCTKTEVEVKTVGGNFLPFG